MRTITLEEHFVTPMLLDVSGTREPTNKYMAAVQPKLLDIGDARVADMDAAGISLQVLSLTGVEMQNLDADTATAVARDANKTAASAVNAHPNRYAAFAALALQDPGQAANEFKRCINELGFVGAMVNGTTGGLFLDDPRFAPVLAAAVELDVPIYLHPSPPPPAVTVAYYDNLPGNAKQMFSTAAWGWHVETGLHVLRMIAAGVFDRFPGLKIIIGHMGEDLPFSIARADSVLARMTPPLSRKPSDILQSNIWITTSGYFTHPPFHCAMSVMGADRILFSVDYPFSTNAVGYAFLDSLQISTADKEKIAHGNAERLLKL